VALDKIVKSMLDDFKLSSNAESDNRTRALFVLDFIRPGADQFSPDQISARGNRPCHSFNQLPKFGRQVINDQWQNLPQIKYIPTTDADVEKAELLEDMIREVQSQGCAQTAYKLAIASQVNIGWAYFAFCTDYDNDESNDQNIYIRQIPNTFQVYDDPACREQDRSDRRFLIEIEDIPRSEFNERYERSYTESELKSIGDDYPSWAEMGKDLVRVGHYWRKEYDKQTVWFNKETGKKVTEKPKDIENYNERVIKKPRVMYYKCTAREKIEERKWYGKHIPFCFVEGNKTIVNGKTYYTGIYEDMISTQILYNYATNTAIELAESAPIAPLIGDIRAFNGLEKYYDTVNQKNYSYLPYNAIDESGNPVDAPQRMQNGADLSSAVALIQMAEQNFYGTSGIYPASLGQQSNEKSGKAIMARQREGDVSTSNYSDMFRRALIYGGTIYEDLRKYILDGSREVKAQSEDNKTRVVKINQRYTDPKTGKTVEYDMTKGDMGVSITTGASYTTKREESRESQIQLFQAAPQAMLPALPMIVRSMDWPNADKTADAIERGLPPELRDPERQAEQMQNVPPAVQAQLQQAQQIIQQLGQALEEAQQAANDKQAEAQVKIGELQIKAQSAQTQAEKNQADMELKAAELQLEREKFTVSSALEAQRLELDKIKLLTEQQRQPEAKQMAGIDEDALMAGLGENALRGYEMDRQAKMERERIEAEMEAEKEFEEKQNAEMQKQNMNAMIEMLLQMRSNFEQLSADIRAPKVIDVVRNPDTMLIEQVTTKAVQ
jgi:hypothetical protein